MKNKIYSFLGGWCLFLKHAVARGRALFLIRGGKLRGLDWENPDLKKYKWLKECCYVKIALLYVITPLPVLIVSAVILKSTAYIALVIMFAFYVVFIFWGIFPVMPDSDVVNNYGHWIFIIMWAFNAAILGISSANIIIIIVSGAAGGDLTPAGYFLLICVFLSNVAYFYLGKKTLKSLYNINFGGQVELEKLFSLAAPARARRRRLARSRAVALLGPLKQYCSRAGAVIPDDFLSRGLLFIYLLPSFSIYIISAVFLLEPGRALLPAFTLVAIIIVHCVCAEEGPRTVWYRAPDGTYRTSGYISIWLVNLLLLIGQLFVLVSQIVYDTARCFTGFSVLLVIVGLFFVFLYAGYKTLPALVFPDALNLLYLRKVIFFWAQFWQFLKGLLQAALGVSSYGSIPRVDWAAMPLNSVIRWPGSKYTAYCAELFSKVIALIPRPPTDLLIKIICYSLIVLFTIILCCILLFLIKIICYSLIVFLTIMLFALLVLLIRVLFPLFILLLIKILLDLFIFLVNVICTLLIILLIKISYFILLFLPKVLYSLVIPFINTVCAILLFLLTASLVYFLVLLLLIIIVYVLLLVLIVTVCYYIVFFAGEVISYLLKLFLTRQS